jgi:hypothetical protein
MDGRFVAMPHCHLVITPQWIHGPEGFVGLFGEPGMDFLFRDLPSADSVPVINHPCAWGYDVHFCRPIKSVDGESPALEAGEVLENGFTIELLSDEESSQIIAKSHELPPTEEGAELLRRTPRYTAGINNFDVGLGRHDESGFWRPATEALWLPGEQCLMLHNDPSVSEADNLTNAWRTVTGSSYFADPIRPNVPYRLVAEVRTEAVVGGARIGLQWMVGKELGTLQEKVFWSDMVWSDGLAGLNDWTLVEVMTPRTPKELICALQLALELTGSGKAWFRQIALSAMTMESD